MISSVLRWLSAFGLATALAVPGSLIAAGVSHQTCAAREHGCGDAKLMSCCCTDASGEAPAAPTARVQVDAPLASTGVAPAWLDVSATARVNVRPGEAPPHGYRFTDRLVFLSTFLI